MDINKFFNFIDSSKSQFHAVYEIKDILSKKGFKELNLCERWNLEKGKQYYIALEGSLFSFSIPNDIQKFNFVGSHTDSPTLMVKPNPVIFENGYVKLNVEIYGGPILNTWYDRPLDFAGKVSYLTDENEVKYELFDTNCSLGIIPNLAIHQNRGVNEGVAIGKQKEIFPIIGISDKIDENFFDEIIAKNLKIKSSKILSHNIFAYVNIPASQVGYENELITAPKIDNLAAVYTSLDAFTEVSNSNSLNFFAAFDNEEVGSHTRFGADSNILSIILNRIKISLNIPEEDFAIILSKSTFISADMAHAIHPNYPEKADTTNKLKINNGIAIKSAVGKYATTAESASKLIKMCIDNEIKYQFFVNRNDVPSGSTIGPAISAELSISTIDIGAPMLAMHSSVETIGKYDLLNMYELFKEFYKN